MCFTSPKAPKPGAPPAPAAAQGADSLVLGPSSQDDEELRNAGVMGRLALLVGRRQNATGTPPIAGVPGASVGVGASSGGDGSPSSDIGLSVGGGSTGGGSGGGGGGGGNSRGLKSA